MTNVGSLFRDPFSAFAGYDPRATAFAGYAQGLQAGLQMAQGGLPTSGDAGLDLALARFMMQSGQGQAAQVNPALAFALRSAMLQNNLGMGPSSAMGFSPQQQALQDFALMIELVSMAMMIGQQMNGCGCRAHNAPLSSGGGWNGGGAVPSGAWGKPGGTAPGGVTNAPIPPGDLPAGTGTGAHLARVAEQVARNRGTVGRCYAGVADSVARAMGVNLHGGSAYMAADQLARSGRFREVRVSPDQLRNLPPGAVVVWGRTGASPHGHISVALGNGREASDHVQNQMTSLRGYQNFRVFIPQG